MRKLLFVIIPIVIFLVAELAVRQWGYTKTSWYRGLSSHMKTVEKLDVIFIGSSRVAAAIDSNVFDIKTGLTSYNIGVGPSKLQSHYFLLRKLFKEYPTKTKGIKVLLEAPYMLPSFTNWSDQWFADEQPQYLINVLNFADLSKLFQSDIDLEKKLLVTFRKLFDWSYLFSYRERIRNGVLSKMKNLFQRSLLQIGIGKKQESKQVDLVSAGGIRTDAIGVNLIKERTITSVAKRMTKQKPIKDWGNTVVSSLITLSKESGGELILFNMPLSTIQGKEYQTEIRHNDREFFQETYLQTDIIKALTFRASYPDKEFPDLLHLAKSKRVDYTTIVSNSFFKMFPN